MSGLNELGKEAYRIAKARGFYAKGQSHEDLICHLHSEVDEAYRATRDCEFIEELADVVILCSSIATYYELNLDDAVARKMKINKERI